MDYKSDFQNGSKQLVRQHIVWCVVAPIFNFLDFFLVLVGMTTPVGSGIHHFNLEKRHLGEKAHKMSIFGLGFAI